MAIWLIAIRPFKTTSNLYINICNEIILVLVFATLYILEEFSEMLFKYSDYIGWALIGIVCFAIFQCWMIIFPLLIRIMRNKFCKKNKTEDDKINPSETM